MKRWDHWCGDRELEAAIRNHLSASGYFGRSATLRRVRLAAVKRPGWLQIYRFDTLAQRRQSENQPPDSTSKSIEHELYGLARMDSRTNRPPEVKIVLDMNHRDDLLAAWREQFF